MSLLILLLVLLLLFGGGGATYGRWGGSGPAWGGNALWLLTVIVLLVLVFSLFSPGRF